MRIQKQDYILWNDPSGYYITNKNSPGNLLEYKLYSMVDSVKTLLSSKQIDGNNTELIVFPKEGIYSVEIVSTEDTYDIRYFPELRVSMIEEFQDYMISNNCITSPCTNSILTINESDVFKSKLNLNIFPQYLNIILSQQFIKKNQCCISKLMNLYNSKILYFTQKAFNSLEIAGDYIDPFDLDKITIALEYLIMYVSTINVESYTYDSQGGQVTPDQDLIKSIDNLFAKEEVKSFFTSIGLNFDYLYNKILECSDTNEILNCIFSTSPTAGCASISDLTYNGYQHIVEVNTIVSPITISWNVSGAPIDLKLNDTDGALNNQDVSGSQYNTGGNLTYVHDTNETMIMTLSGANVQSINNSTIWVYPSFSGKVIATNGAQETLTITPPTNDEIINGTKYLQITSNQLFANVETNAVDYEVGWIAVPKNQTGRVYTKWYMNEQNKGDIDFDGSCGDCTIELVGERTLTLYNTPGMSAQSVVYYLYMYRFPTTIDNNVKYY